MTFQCILICNYLLVNKAEQLDVWSPFYSKGIILNTCTTKIQVLEQNCTSPMIILCYPAKGTGANSKKSMQTTI